MMARWTSEQQKVIDTRDRNILVSAAAGSGKTAVLVERIIQRILDKDNPIDIDKILVVTFTNAAASEMRERILRAIEKELKKNPDDEHLQKQQVYIHNANITTIHSFCLNLVREHFNDIDLDPGVRVADTGEIELLKSDVVKEVLEEYYSSQNEAFYRFVSQFEGKNSDDYLEEMILNLYHKAMGFPMPQIWLEECVRKYEYADVTEFSDSVFIGLIHQYADGTLRELIKKYDSIIEICRNGGPDVYEDNLVSEREQVKAALEEKRYESRRTKLNITFERMPRCGKDCDVELKDYVSSVRKDIRKQIDSLRSGLYGQPLDQTLKDCRVCHDIIETYVEVTRTFAKRFAEKKKDKNIIDFNDFEHYAIEILVNYEEGRFIPTKIADDIAKDFVEVMVDEYQDSNAVQETIISSISGERFGVYNRFMVGDVKQSIYGFRGANPDIFVEKYDTYLKDMEAKEYKIILDRNFRSRDGVITSTNFFFEQLMNRELGGIHYDEENMLYTGVIYPECEDERLRNRIDDKTELILIHTQEQAEEDNESDDNTSQPQEKRHQKGMQKTQSQTNNGADSDEMSEDEEDMSATAYEAEAKVIALKIKEMTNPKNGMIICDKETGEYRSVKYSDIVILMRSMGENAEIISEELMKEGIPVYMELKSGYFSTIEIRTIINFLKIIDNPIQDLPLAAVLKSPIVGMNDEGIAKIRVAGGREVSLYENICAYVDNPDICMDSDIPYDSNVADSLRNFLAVLDGFREKTRYMSIYDLVNSVIHHTGYYNYVAAMPAGARRIANIAMLKQKAADYENGSYKGLFNFIRYIEKMDKYNVDMGEASIISENDNTVRMMTIHKSKGLEFPVVFIANINKSFNFMDARKKCVIHSEYGIGMDYIDEDTKVQSKNIIKSAIAKRIELDVIEEEMRVFYVACTRARDKLILTATGVDEKRLGRMITQRFNNELYLGYGVVCKMKSYLDFVTLSLGRNKAFNKIYREQLAMEAPCDNAMYYKESNVEVRYVSMKELFKSLIKEQYVENMSTENLENIRTEWVYDKDIRQELTKRLSFIYKYQKEVTTNAKMSVSEIKKISYESEEIRMACQESEELFTELVENCSDETGMTLTESADRMAVTGAARGTVYHTVFELFDFDMEPSRENIEKFVEKIYKSGRISGEERDSIQIEDLLAFTRSNLYHRMRAAHKRGELHREAQFVVGFADSEIDEFKHIAAEIGREKRIVEPARVEPKGDTILIQGVIDAYFIEDGKIVIADYKTDKVKYASSLRNHYYVQLELYKKAVEQITGRSVSEKILYSVTLGQEIQC